MAAEWLRNLAGKVFGRTSANQEADPPPPGPTPRDRWLVPGIYFDTSGWSLVDASATSMSWTQGLSRITLTIAARDRSTSAHLDGLRRQHRAIARAMGRDIVSVDRPAIRGDDVEVVTKRRTGPGFAFEGVRIVVRGECEYAITVAAPEQLTGMREAFLSSQIVRVGELRLDDVVQSDGGRRILNWVADPYDAEFDADALHSMADDARLDALFPDHPLSFIRATLRRIGESLEIDGVRSSDGSVAGGGVSDHTRPAMSLAGLREAYWQTGRNDLLQGHLMECLATDDPNGESNSPDVARLLLMLGQAQHNSGNLPSAVRVFRRAHTIFAGASSGHRREAAIALTGLARTLRRLELLEEASHTIDRALGIFAELKDEGLHRTLALGIQVDLLLAQGRGQAAEAIAERAYRLLPDRSTMGPAGLHELCGGQPTGFTTKTVTVRPS